MISFVENLLILVSLFFALKAYFIWGLKIILDSLVILFGAKLFERSFEFQNLPFLGSFSTYLHSYNWGFRLTK